MEKWVLKLICFFYVVIKIVELGIISVNFEDHAPEHFQIIGIVHVILFFGAIVINYFNFYYKNSRFYGEFVYLIVVICNMVATAITHEQSLHMEDLESNQSSYGGSKYSTMAKYSLFIQIFNICLALSIGSPKNFGRRLRNNNDRNNDVPLQDRPPPYSVANLQAALGRQSSTPPPSYLEATGVVKSSSESTLSRRSSQLSISSQDSSNGSNKGAVAKETEGKVSKSPEPHDDDGNKSTSRRIRRGHRACLPSRDS